jgi:hypothetical protein
LTIIGAVPENNVPYFIELDKGINNFKLDGQGLTSGILITYKTEIQVKIKTKGDGKALNPATITMEWQNDETVEDIKIKLQDKLHNAKNNNGKSWANAFDYRYCHLYTEENDNVNKRQIMDPKRETGALINDNKYLEAGVENDK